MALDEEKYVVYENTKNHPGASLRWLARKIRSRQFRFGKSKCPGAHLDLTVNFHHEHFMDPTNSFWVSEDVGSSNWESCQCLREVWKTKFSKKTNGLALGQKKMKNVKRKRIVYNKTGFLLAHASILKYYF